jgi:Amino acid synthesis
VNLVWKVVTVVEDTLIEGRKPVPRPFRMVATAAVLTNSWPTREHAENLRPTILELAPDLAELIIPRAVEAVGGATAIEAFGKAGLVGAAREIEHAAAFIHTLRFGNELRKAAGGNSFIPFTNLRGGPGAPITVPLKHKLKANEGSRAHFLTMSFVIPDAPAEDELVVAIALATGGRPHARIGDRYQDMSDMGVDQTGAPLRAD